MPNERLLRIASDAATRAYCRYSNFRVGAAVEVDGGSVFDGCNIENASSGLTICAERVAIFSAVAAGKRPISIAVVCADGDPKVPSTLMPCGACRQVMTEFMPADAIVYVNGVGDFRLDELLPKPFQLPPSP